MTTKSISSIYKITNSLIQFAIFLSNSGLTFFKFSLISDCNNKLSKYSIKFIAIKVNHNHQNRLQNMADTVTYKR